MATYLLSRGADVNAVDEKSVSACLIASATGKSCAPPPRVHVCMPKSRPALCACSRGGSHLSSCAGSEQLLNELISRGADVKVAAAGGVTALHVAAEAGDLGIVRALLEVLPLGHPSIS